MSGPNDDTARHRTATIGEVRQFLSLQARAEARLDDISEKVDALVHARATNRWAAGTFGVAFLAVLSWGLLRLVAHDVSIARNEQRMLGIERMLEQAEQDEQDDRERLRRIERLLQDDRRKEVQ